jgi:hypothetical protein
MAKIITTAAVMFVLLLLLILSTLHLFGYQTAYSQMSNDMPRSQNLSSLLKNLLGPQKQVSGHYSNPQFGITDIVFPEGWHGSEMPPIVGLTVITHPGNEANQSSSSSSLSDIISPIALAQPQMILQVLNNSDLANVKENSQAFSISKVCKPLAQNTTSVIDGRTFNIATIECPLPSLINAQMERMMSSRGGSSNNQSNFAAGGGGGIGGLFKSLNLNPNAVMQSKLYEFKTPDKTYRLGLVVSNLFSPQTSEKPDVSKYTQSLDTTANTLKFR